MSLTPQPMRVNITEAGAVSGAATPTPVPLHLANCTPGSAAPLQVVMPDSNGNIDLPAGTSMSIAGAAVSATGVSVVTTATGAELSALHSQGCVAADYAKLHAMNVLNAMPVIVTTGLVNTTLANVNLGTYAAGPILAHLTSHQFVPTEIKMRCNGTPTVCTALNLIEESSGAVIFSTAIANLTTGVWAGITSSAANTLGVAGTSGKGIYITATGVLTTTTSVDVILTGYWI